MYSLTLEKIIKYFCKDIIYNLHHSVIHGSEKKEIIQRSNNSKTKTINIML